MTESVNVENNTHSSPQDDTVVGTATDRTGAEQQSELLMGYYTYLDELAAERDLPDFPYKENLADDVRASLLQQSKIERANERRDEVKVEYAQAVEKTHAQIAERKEALRSELYDIPPEMLVQVSVADEEQLRRLADAAVQAGKAGEPIAKALMLTSQQRELGEVGVAVLQAFPHLEAPLREWQSLPTEEMLERRRDPAHIEQIVPKPDPDRLRTRPRLDR